MKKAKKGGISLLGIIIALIVLKNIVPILAGIISLLIKLSIVAFLVLIVAVIVKGVKGDGKETASRPAVNVKTHGVNSGSTANATRPLTPEERQALSGANSDLVALRAMSARIKDKEIADLFNNAANVISDILKALKTDPDDIKPAHRVLSYYLPSLRIMMEKYLRLEASGTDMGDTPEKLKQHLKEIAEALGKQNANLYSNDKLDLTVEMKAMSMALKRDGLIGDDIASQQLAHDLEQVIEDFGMEEKQEEEPQLVAVER